MLIYDQKKELLLLADQAEQLAEKGLRHLRGASAPEALIRAARLFSQAAETTVTLAEGHGCQDAAGEVLRQQAEEEVAGWARVRAAMGGEA